MDLNRHKEVLQALFLRGGSRYIRKLVHHCYGEKKYAWTYVNTIRLIRVNIT